MNPDSPFISVIIPTFNRGELLRETLESLRMQDSRDWEAIIVDDGSDDNSAEIVNSYVTNDSRFRFFYRDCISSGAPVCRNIGIQHAKGDFLIFLDSDDLLKPFTLSQRLAVIRKEPAYDFWVFPMLLFRNDPQQAYALWNIDNGKDNLRRFLVLDAPWQTTGPVWRKEAVKKIGGFTEGLACWQDIDFHLKALTFGLKGLILWDEKPDVLYRQHETKSVSQADISSPAKLISRQNIFIRHASSFLPSIKPEIRNDLRVLGGNIVIGSAKALNFRVFNSVVRFGLRKGIFSPSTTIKLLLLWFFYFLRLNRVAFLNKKMQLITGSYRQDSNIGKHSFKQT